MSDTVYSDRCACKFKKDWCDENRDVNDEMKLGKGFPIFAGHGRDTSMRWIEYRLV